MKRRQLLHLAGTGFVVALSGCSGNDSGSSGNPETDSQSGTQTSTATSTEAQDTTETEAGTTTSETESGENRYPTEQNNGKWEKIIENRCDSWEDWYCFKVDNYHFINTNGVEAGSEGGNADYTLAEALATAVNLEVDGKESDTIYFFVNPTSIDEERRGDATPGQISMYVNSGDWSQRQFNQTVIGNAEGITWDEADPQTVEDAYTDFFTERIDGNGIVDHAGEIPEYARDAFESGWQAE